MRATIAATLMIVSRRGLRASADLPSTVGRVKPKPARPARPAVQTPADTAKAMAQAERQAFQSDLAWTGHYNGIINGEVSDRLIAAIKAFQKDQGGKQTGVLNPQERGVLAAAARNRAGQCRLEDRHRCRHRRAARPAGQTGAAAVQRRQRHQMEFVHRHDPDPAGAAQGSQPHHRQARRSGEEGAGRPQDRVQRRQAGFLRAVGHAGSEEILSARPVQRRARPAS